MITIAKKLKKTNGMPTRNIAKEITVKELLRVFKKEVTTSIINPKFIHHAWFLRYHLIIVEKIALEICNYYPQADKNIVLLLVWLHDYGKIIDFHNQYKTTLSIGKKKLLMLGFPQEIVEKTIMYIAILDRKSDITQAPIEVQVVSSADGAAHLVGPFYAIYWKEHYNYMVEKLMKENKRKALIDWNKKIVLPEVKKAFLSRHSQLLERCGKFPKKYLSRV